MNLRLLAAVAFLATILAANYATTHWGLVSVGFGLMATAGMPKLLGWVDNLFGGAA